MAADDTDFGTEMRGYRKEAVDKAIQDLRRELIKANADRAEGAKEIKRLAAVAEDLQAELDETGTPTYSGLGTKLENTLRVAEEQSTRLISQADIDAEKLRNSVKNEIQKLSTDAHETADRLVSEATAQSKQVLET
jgi:cell division septum initiation protein DivIVA